MNPTSEPVYSYLVVVTYGRSGSTLLQRILQSIPGYCIRGENQMAFMPLMDAVNRARKAHREFGQEPRAPDHPWYGIDNVNADRFAMRLRDVFVEEILQPPQDARVVGFKEIRWFGTRDAGFFELLDFLRTRFAPCRIVFNTRSAEGVAASSFWKQKEKSQVLAMVHSQDALYNAYRDLHPDTCFVVNYDEYVRNTGHLRDLFRFLDEPFDASRIDEILAEKLDH